MENDLADEGGLFLEFDSIFDEEDLVDNQTNHTPSKQQTETEGNMSSENVELGSSCGSNIDEQPLMNSDQGPISSTEKENLTIVSSSAFTSTSIELSDRPPLENDPNMAPLLWGTPDNTPLMGTPQNELYYSKDIINSELGVLWADCDRGQVHAQNQSLDPSRHIDAHSSGCEEISSGPPFVDDINAPNFQQLDLGTLSSFNPVLPGPPQQYPPLQNQMGMSTTHVDGVLVQSFYQENRHDPSQIYSYHHLNACTENVPQVLNQHIPLPQYGTIMNNQLVQNNNTNSNFIDSINHQQHSSLYAGNYTILPPNTMITGGGVVNQIRPINPQQQAIFAPQLMNNGAYNARPLANIINSPGYSWPQQLSSQDQQISSQVPSMANVVNYDPNCQYSTQPPGYSTPLRPQNISYPSTLYDPPVFNSMLQPDHHQVPFNPRPSQIPYPCQQLNNELLASTHNSIMPASSIMSSRIPPASPSNDHGQQLNKNSPATPMIGVLDSQHYSNFNITQPQRSFVFTSTEPSTLSRYMCDNNQRQLEIISNETDPDQVRGFILLRPSFFSRSQTEKSLVVNGTIRPNSGGVYGANSQDSSTHFLNSKTEQQEQEDWGSTGLAVTNQNSRSSSTKERETILGRRGRTRTTKRQEVGESSKRFRKEVVVRKEKVIKFGTSYPKENDEADNSKDSSRPSTDSRKIENAVYDPLFEGMGLAVDPHIRLFAST